MRICLVSRELAPFFGSGIGVYAAEAARAWVAAGHDMHVLTADHAGLAEGAPRELPGVRVHAASELEGPGAALPEPRGAVLWPLVAYDRLWRLHQAERFDYVEFADFAAEGYFAIQGRRLLPGRPEGLPGCVLGVRLHMPSALINHANGRAWRGRHSEYTAHMEREAIAGADLVFAPCRAVVEALRAMGVQVEDSARRPVVVSANPFVPVPARSDQGGSAGDDVVFVGRLERRKGPDLLVRAAIGLLRERPGLRVRLIGGDTGTGPLDTSVAEWIAGMVPPDLQDRLVLEGQRPREACIAAMARAAAVCFPARWDNWPYAVLEAMSLGACIVASDSGGHAEMLEDGQTALLARAGDPASLAAALRRALDEPGLRPRLGAAAREAAMRLGDPRTFADQTAASIEAVRGTNENSPPPSPGRSDASRAAGPQSLDAQARGGSAITVVIPHKDMPDHLPDTLESLAHQTIRGFRVILVDDGSTSPRALELLDRLEHQHTPGPPEAPFTLRIIRRRPEHAAHAGVRGPAAARNLGIAAADTPLIVTLDADDLLAPAHLETCAAALAARPDLACVGTLVSYFDEHPDRPTGAWAPLGLVRDLLPAMNTMGTGSGIMFRREALATLRGPGHTSGGVPAPGRSEPFAPFDPDMPGYEDWDLYCAMAAAGLRGQVVPLLLTHYRVRPGSRYHGHDRRRHDRLVAELASRYPALALHPDVSMRVLLAESRARARPLKRQARKWRRAKQRLERENQRLRDRVDRLRATLDARRDGRPWLHEVGSGRQARETPAAPGAPLPLRYRAADRAVGALRRAGLSGAARRILLRLRRPPAR